MSTGLSTGALFGFGLAVFVVPLLMLFPVIVRILFSAPAPIGIPLSWMHRNGIYINDESLDLVLGSLLFGFGVMLMGGLLAIVGRRSRKNTD